MTRFKVCRVSAVSLDRDFDSEASANWTGTSVGRLLRTGPTRKSADNSGSAVSAAMTLSSPTWDIDRNKSARSTDVLENSGVEADSDSRPGGLSWRPSFASARSSAQVDRSTLEGLLLILYFIHPGGSSGPGFSKPLKIPFISDPTTLPVQVTRFH